MTTVLIWGLNVTVVKLLLGSFHPMALAVTRFVIVTSVFALIVPVLERGPPRVAARYLPLLILAGLCGIWLNQVAFTYGLQNTTAANMSLLITTIPIFAGIGSFLFGWERPGWRHWAGIVIGFAGVAMVVLASPGTSHGHVTLWGDLLALLTAASWAGYSLALRSLMRVYSAFKISLYVALTGLVALLPFGLPQFPASHLTSLTPHDWLLVGYSSLGAVVLTNILWYTGVHRLGPARATVYAYFQPFAGVVFAVLILKEPLAILQLLGGVTIVAGVIFGREPRPQAVLAE